MTATGISDTGNPGRRFLNASPTVPEAQAAVDFPPLVAFFCPFAEEVARADVLESGRKSSRLVGNLTFLEG